MQSHLPVKPQQNFEFTSNNLIFMAVNGTVSTSCAKQSWDKGYFFYSLGTACSTWCFHTFTWFCTMSPNKVQLLRDYMELKTSQLIECTCFEDQ